MGILVDADDIVALFQHVAALVLAVKAGHVPVSYTHLLLMDILRGEWGFDGAVVTDWGGSNDHALGVQNLSLIHI